MHEHLYKFVECEGVRVAVFIEARNENEHDGYYPENLLFFVNKGNLSIRTGGKTYTAQAGTSLFLRKFTYGQFAKSWNEEEGKAIVYAFALQDQFIREMIREYQLSPLPSSSENRVALIRGNTILQGLFDSIGRYVNKEENIDRNMLKLKSQEAILGIMQDNPDHLSVFYEFANQERADLVEFMNFHYGLNIPLEELARLSGRSLSTFKRDFKKIFQMPPHRWMMKKRLEEAKKLLQTSDKSPSEIYLTLGFEDLSHFSRRFKKEFGMSPNQYRLANS